MPSFLQLPNDVHTPCQDIVQLGVPTYRSLLYHWRMPAPRSPTLCRDFALVADETVELRPGLNVVTGESGAGKSVLVTVLGQLLGFPAIDNCIRPPASCASVEGSVHLPGSSVVRICVWPSLVSILPIHTDMLKQLRTSLLACWLQSLVIRVWMTTAEALTCNVAEVCTGPAEQTGPSGTHTGRCSKRRSRTHRQTGDCICRQGSAKQVGCRKQSVSECDLL